MGSVIDENQQPLLLAENKIEDLKTRVWIETKKLWHIVGPAIFSRIASYTMNIITQSFAGHLGEVQLAAISISNTVIVGLNFGLLVCTYPLNFFQILHYYLYSSAHLKNRDDLLNLLHQNC